MGLGLNLFLFRFNLTSLLKHFVFIMYNSVKHNIVHKINQQIMNRFRLNFLNSLLIYNKKGQILVKNQKRFQIFKTPEYLELEETLLYLNKNCT